MTGLVRRHTGAVVRGLALGGLAVAAAVSFALHLAVFVPGFAFGLVILLPHPLVAARRLPNLARRLAGRWSGVEIAAPYRPRPQPPKPGPDGLYERDRQLYRRPWFPAQVDRIDWVLGDSATWRDLRWTFLEPLVGGPLALLPAVLIAGGGWLGYAGVTGVGGAGWWAVLPGLLAVATGIAVAPALLSAHGRWTRLLLRPAEPTLTPARRWILLRLLVLARMLALLGLTVLVVPVAVLSALAVVLSYGLGIVVVMPPVIEHFRPLTNLRRRLTRWSGVDVPEPYRPRPPLRRRPDGLYQVDKSLYETPRMAAYIQRMFWLTRDPASWRDILWQLLDPLVGGALLVVPLAAIGYGIWGLALPRITVLIGVRVDDLGPWHGNVAGNGAIAVPVGLALAAAGILAAPWLLRLHGRWTALLLGPTLRARLALRVQRLTQTRADATEVQAAELRRIERDLHDGAQARLVALGLTLGAAEQLVERDPAAARELLAEARDNAARALTELRDLVRGIHPPVLAERGLADAVRALAMDCPLPVEVTVDLPARPEAPVESAAYFAVSELITNAVRHAGAGRITVDIGHRGDDLRIVVTDDGHGGADPARGTGLPGIERRLGTFDGVVTIDSPSGGPTTVVLELPCALSSPRTSTS
ncbi:sensor histidine kinase [Polymorphospora rubra]|uniref:histidine kinase n=1 Tax=Polymorphospora rubra TaxID=338584 RepID=A0A810MZQ4_9ACTN|nr:histidine kinase [Polymorphospora rubra]BCJ66612.1 histidine kinase [Polymorphospora rubra]